MSTINRLLSRKDKHSHGSHKDKPKQNKGPLNGLFIAEEERKKTTEKDEEKKIKTISQRLARKGIRAFKEADIAYVLNAAYANGDTEKAFELLMLLEDSEEGIIQSYNPNVKLLGAINREGVTCYLDSLLFAMFARLGSFEAMLYKNFEDLPRKRLATLLRLWVNTLRAGKLITTDITKQIQLQLASCGWKEAAELCQQDVSEAFTFITSTLALPLLTLKMDIFHTGKEDVSDDHKFVNERLLELAIPEDPGDGRVITLEDCLEMFFNNKIEVKRYLDMLERRNTLSSMRSRRSVDSTKAHTSHVEVAELDNSQPSSPVAQQPQVSAIPVSPVRPTAQRHRAPSIIQEHYISEKSEMLDCPSSIDEKGPLPGRVRKEVMMPAWQFFSLIPWYTNSIPSNDAQVAAHFSSTRPILGICLKRYSMLPNGTAVKRKTHIDIPLEIGLPHFIQDDTMSEDGPAFGNFKLSLQSVICHQGVSVESGHYISLVRSPDPKSQGEDRWMRFDDLAKERVAYVNVEQFLREESPYLLFYQVIPIEDDSGNITESEHPITNDENPPAYSDSQGSRDSAMVDSAVADLSSSTRASYLSNGVNLDFNRPSLEIHRPSLDEFIPDSPRGRSSIVSEMRQSIAFSDISTGSARADYLSTPQIGISQADGPGTLTASRRGSKTTNASSKSRPNSQLGEKRMSTSLSRLASRMSRDKLTPPPLPQNQEASKDYLNGNAPTTAYEEDNSQRVLVPSRLQDDKPPDRAKLKKEAKEKSKADQREHQHLVKRRHKSAKPDRECSVM